MFLEARPVAGVECRLQSHGILTPAVAPEVGFRLERQIPGRTVSVKLGMHLTQVAPRSWEIAATRSST
jgi:hypothetical protein